MNNIVLVGRLTADPELKYIPGSGTPSVKFTIAVDRDYKNKDGSTTTDFIPVEIMGKPAEFVANYVGKGRLVGVQGSMRVDRYTDKQGNTKSYTKVQGRQIQALESKAKQGDATQQPTQPTQPTFKPSDIVDPNGFQTVEDDDVPF